MENIRNGEEPSRFGPENIHYGISNSYFGLCFGCYYDVTVCVTFGLC